MSDYSEQLRVAAHAAKEAGKLLRDLFDKAHTVKEKSKFEGFVTEADLASEKIILSELKKAFPDYSILSEEAGEERKNSNYMWLVDPLDGTTNFKIKNPFFNVSIGLAKGKQIVMGVIYSPILDELFYSIEGRGAYLNGKKISISDTSNFSSSVIAFCHGGKNQKAIERALKIYSKLKLLSNHTRQFGAAALEFCYLAAGRMDIVEITDTNPWDVGAGSLIAKEAGAVVTDLSGNPWDTTKKDILAANSKLHSQLLKILKGF
ncbi:MAG TPA: inositol monophosphatase family protein [archaeon]|nr:inositol monophosphatase family protein [archaeon]